MTGNEVFIHEKIYRAWYQKRKRFTVIFSGRGAGKTTTTAIIIILESLSIKRKVLCIRGFQKTLKDSSLAALKKAIYMMKLEKKFEITKNSLRSLNGTEFIFSGSQHPLSWKSLEAIDICWIDEAVELTEEAWDILLPTIRKPRSRFIITFNPEKSTDYVYREFVENEHPNTELISLSWRDNPFFPENQKELLEYDRNRNKAKYMHIWEGGLRQDIEGALVKRAWLKWLNELTIEEKENLISGMEKIVIAIDPSVSSKDTSDACGIIVAGKVANVESYVIIEDRTKIQSPDKWVSEAIQLYHEYHANCIIYEKNQGGDVIKALFRHYENSIPLVEIWAKRGKLLRGEKVAVLYEQGKIFHMNRFVDLEFQLTSYIAEPGEPSPNNMDAAVYAILELAQKKYGMVPENLNQRIW